ncbi:hypothetical protein BH23BAC1_BH23BAC1_03970 [soil metagenome]
MLNFKKMSFLLLGATLTFQACNNNNDFKTTDSGLQYKFVRTGDGPKPEKGQILTLNMTYQNANDTTPIFNTADQGAPVPIQYNDSLPPDAGAIEEGFAMLKKGDSVIFLVPAKDLYEKTFRASVPEGVDSASLVTFHIGVKDVMTEEDYNAQMMKEFEERQTQALQKDNDIIESYLDENDIQAQQTESGLRYTILREGAGAQPQTGDSVSVHYVGKLLNGELFDTSREAVAKENDMHDPRNPYQPLSFVHGRGQMIPGFDEGVGLLKKGSQARLFLPSALAYGERGAGGRIGPNSVLIFDIELVDVKK